MHVRDLREDAGFNFVDQADATLSKVASHAKTALGRLKAGYANADASLRYDARRGLEQQAADSQAAEKTKQKEKAKPPREMTLDDHETMLVDMLLDPKGPTPDGVKSTAGAVDASQFQEMINVAEKMNKRVGDALKIYRSVLKSSFLDANERTDTAINDILGDQPTERLQKVEAFMFSNVPSAKSAVKLWTLVLTSDDVQLVGSEMLKWLRSTSKDNDQRMQANMTKAQKIQLPVGSGLARVLAGQLQVMDARAANLLADLNQAENTSMTESLRRMRRLLQRL